MFEKPTVINRKEKENQTAFLFTLFSSTTTSGISSFSPGFAVITTFPWRKYIHHIKQLMEYNSYKSCHGHAVEGRNGAQAHANVRVNGEQAQMHVKLHSQS